MVYEGGAQCWNGPKRSLRVVVECGDVNAVVGISEPSKCEYVMRVRSPGACDLNRHDELYFLLIVSLRKTLDLWIYFWDERVCLCV
jgi:hypothetical protein